MAIVPRRAREDPHAGRAGRIGRRRRLQPRRRAQQAAPARHALGRGGRGRDAATDAAGVASAVFPGTSDTVRPTAVVLVDGEDWQAGVTAAVLAAPPIGAPLMISEGKELPPVSADTLGRL